MPIATPASGTARPQPLSPSRQVKPPSKEARRLLQVFSQGMKAAADYRRLDAMTDGQLAAQGLTRANLPRHLFERHFAD